jgi:hypothetical protein
LTDDAGSKVHIYGTVPGYFLTAFVLGARRVGSVAERSIVIEPRCGGLSHAAGVAVTEFGPVDMQWSRVVDGTLSINCSVPKNVKATLRLYRSGVGEFIVLDGQRTKASAAGSFVEATLLPGRHEIRYPG